MYNWKLKDANFTKDKGKVFSCFACGGGSTMGYKLAGFDVLGCNEIDPKMMKCYIKNHRPKYHFLQSIKEFKVRKDLPQDLYNLDILDGSPPCSSFSVAGNREKDWGKEKKFREGQASQVLDTLFFDFIDLAKELRPKVVIAENVKGMLIGKARDYVKKIVKEFDKAGYYIQYFLLNSKKMGVPQKRERVFFIGLRKDLAKPFLYQKDLFTQLPFIDMEFHEKEIPFKEVYQEESEPFERPLTDYKNSLWEQRIEGDIDLSYSCKRVEGKENHFNSKYIYHHKVANTITASDGNIIFRDGRYMNKKELSLVGSYPQDYHFYNLKPAYLIGMSVPPVMTYKIAQRIYKQWLNKI